MTCIFGTTKGNRKFSSGNNNCKGSNTNNNNNVLQMAILAGVFFSSVFRFALVSQHFATEQRKSRGKCLSLAEIGESLSQLNNSMSAMWPLHIFFGSMTERNL